MTRLLALLLFYVTITHLYQLPIFINSFTVLMGIGVLIAQGILWAFLMVNGDDFAKFEIYTRKEKIQ